MSEPYYKGTQVLFPDETAEELFDNAPCGYISFLEDGRIIKMNQTLLNWLDYEIGEVENQIRIQDLLKIGGQIYFETHIFPLLKLQGFIKEINLDLVRKDGRTFPTLLNVVQVKSLNLPVFYRISLFEISGRKGFERELIDAKNKAVSLIQNKAEFLSTISHEIRTPLSAIMGLVNLFQKTDLSPIQKEYAHLLLQTSENLIELANNLLDMSKIEAEKVTLEEKIFSLSHLTETLNQTFYLKCQEKNIKFSIKVETDVPDNLIGDPVKLSQILINLVANAIKFTEKGFVTLKISLLSKNKNKAILKFKVTDTGMGIPLDKQDTIFLAFSQASYDVNQRFGGTGLGLTISQRILEMHNSKMTVKSEVGKGSEFSFDIEFEVNLLKLEKKVPEPLNPYLMHSKRILIVDDSKINVFVLSKFLETWNVSFEAVEDGNQAVEAVQENIYDLILMDLNMPIMDGYEASRTIRQLDLVKQPIIIALSAMNKEDISEKLQNSGFNGFAQKPFRPDELFQNLSEHLCNVASPKSEYSEIQSFSS